ncbi:hypothetical protein [Terrisporobacter othiniensis]|nr:hypothetical protein [Terrisporobacter othiniensis]
MQNNLFTYGGYFEKTYKIFIAILVIALTATGALGCSKNTYLYTKENEYKEK